MPVIDILKETQVKDCARLQMLSGIFDCPIEDVNKFEIKDNLPIEDFDWQIGLIVGPSGCGKSSILTTLGKCADFSWDNKSVITSFSCDHSVKDIASALNSVGFGNVRAWMRPYDVLSNGEKFRAYCARAILESDSPVLLDEFTSVVDRQVAKIACHAIQKYTRQSQKKMIVASCHEDIIEWLQPDWFYEPHVKKFTRRSLCRRPSIEVEIYETKHSTWPMFAPYHYMSAKLHKAAKCYVLLCNGAPASFAGVLHRPISNKGKHTKPIWGISRVVTHPDYQGLGLAFVLMDFLGNKYKSENKRLRMYPAHPILVRSFENSSKWVRKQKYGKLKVNNKGSDAVKWIGDRMCAIYEYVG